MSIEIKDGTYTGNFGGRLLNGLAVPSIPGVTPAAGWYHIAPPVEDIVFGLVAVMSPTGALGGSQYGGKLFPKDDWTQFPKYFDNDTSANKKYVKDMFGGGASGGKLDKWRSIEWKWTGGSAPMLDKWRDPVSGAIPFVISSRPIPGRNCLVIPSRFADFMDALRISGGVDVRVY